MIGFGGFITLPPAFAFLIMGKPIFTHEQNSVIGSANKVLSKFLWDGISHLSSRVAVTPVAVLPVRVASKLVPSWSRR